MSNLKSIKKLKRATRRKRIKSKIFGTADRPRLSVFRSNKNIFIQLIDDNAKKTVLSSFDSKKAAYKTGKALAKKAAEMKIKKIIFDRGGYKFHGIISEVARGAREGGLKF